VRCVPPPYDSTANPRPGRYEEHRFGGRPPHTPAAGLPVISYSDPSVLRVEERAAQRRLERKNQNFNALAAQPAVQEAIRPSEKGFNAPETIEESDIRANLMMRRMARQRQSARRSDIAPRIIPADEVISNLARTERPSRRLRRIRHDEHVVIRLQIVDVGRAPRLVEALQLPSRTDRIALRRCDTDGAARCRVKEDSPRAALLALVLIMGGILLQNVRRGGSSR